MANFTGPMRVNPAVEMFGQTDPALMAKIFATGERKAAKDIALIQADTENRKTSAEERMAYNAMKAQEKARTGEMEFTAKENQASRGLQERLAGQQNKMAMTLADKEAALELRKAKEQRDFELKMVEVGDNMTKAQELRDEDRQLRMYNRLKTDRGEDIKKDREYLTNQWLFQKRMEMQEKVPILKMITSVLQRSQNPAQAAEKVNQIMQDEAKQEEVLAVQRSNTLNYLETKFEAGGDIPKNYTGDTKIFAVEQQKAKLVQAISETTGIPVAKLNTSPDKIVKLVEEAASGNSSLGVGQITNLIMTLQTAVDNGYGEHTQADELLYKISSIMTTSKDPKVKSLLYTAMKRAKGETENEPGLGKEYQTLYQQNGDVLQTINTLMGSYAQRAKTPNKFSGEGADIFQSLESQILQQLQ